MTILDAANTHHFDAILFDMDGTLVDSTPGVEGAWEKYAERYGLDVKVVLKTSHGRRTYENLRDFCGITDEDELQREIFAFEDLIIETANEPGRVGILALPGGIEATRNLEAGSRRPNAVWALCTSATRRYASRALQAAGVTPPEIFVAAEDVKEGKPAPDPYALGAKLCNAEPSKCLVLEDAPAGIISGNAAGCKTLGVITTHTREQMQAVKPDWLVKNLASVTFTLCPTGGVDVTIHGEQFPIPN